MPVTVPLNSPVWSVADARALAAMTLEAEADAPVGPAIDRILRFYSRMPLRGLVRHRHIVGETLDLLPDERSNHMLRWLVRHSEDAETARYWRRFLLRAA